MAETWDESKPAGSRSPTLGDDDIREFKRAMRERLAEDHDFEATESPAFGAALSTIGKHKFVTLIKQTASKVTDADEVAFVCKDVSGSPEVMLTPQSAGADRQITKNAGANLNLVSGDFVNGIISTAMLADLGVTAAKIADLNVTAAKIAAGAVSGDKIPNNGITSDHINALAVITAKIADAAVTYSKMADFESAGSNNYFPSGTFAGANNNTQNVTWTKLGEFRVALKGTYRIYWQYKQEINNLTGFWRILKNDVEIVSVSDTGTSGGDPFHIRTDDLALVPNDEIEFQAKVDNGSATAETNIWLRGATKTGFVIEI
jgi:hypothetical protein